MKKLIQGVGINDADYKVLGCPFYQKWQSMLTRCYSSRQHQSRPTYKDCSVCEEWLTFSNFKRWMEQQDWQGKQLDKDIIKPGNKVYSPETCCFISLELNSILNGTSKSELPKGVYRDKRTGKFRSSICTNGKLRHLGVFKSQYDAAKAYQSERKSYLIQRASEQEDVRVKNGLEKIAGLI